MIALKVTSAGNCTTRPLAPERIVPDNWLSSVWTVEPFRTAALRSLLSKAAVFSAYVLSPSRWATGGDSPLALVEVKNDLKLHSIQVRHVGPISHFSNQRIKRWPRPLKR
jgi:hypothetical protein